MSQIELLEYALMACCDLWADCRECWKRYTYEERYKDAEEMKSAMDGLDARTEWIEAELKRLRKAERAAKREAQKQKEKKAA